jgi:TRAP-type mannitol/chloroaromatic compound transport system substrate-binding protein
LNVSSDSKGIRTKAAKRAPTPSRRKFLKGAAVTAAGATATLAMPQISRAETTVLKMQGSWGAGDIFNDYAKQYVDMVNEMGGGRLKIDYLNAGAVVKAFEVQDAVNKGVLDAGHLVPAYWFGKNRAASLFGTGPCYGWDAHELLSWFYYGGGDKLYQDLTQKVLGLNVVGFFLMPMPTQPLGWFKFHPKTPADLKNLKYRTVGLATNVMQAMGLKVTQLPGGEIIPAMEKGVIEAFEYNNPTSDRRFGAADVAKYYMMGSYHQPSEMLEIEFNKSKWDSLPKEHQAILRNAVFAASSTNLWMGLPQYATDLQALIHKDGVHVYRTSESIFDAQLNAWDKVVQQYSTQEQFKKISDAQKAWAKNVSYYVLLNQHDTKLAYNHYYGKEQPLGF